MTKMTPEIEQYLRSQIIRVRGGTEYLPVQARVHWFRTLNPLGRIETEMIFYDSAQQIAVFKASVYNGDGKLLATATKMESGKEFSDYLEKAETGAIGRALALAGYGTQFAPELLETDSGPPTQPSQMVDSGRQPMQTNHVQRAKMPTQRPAAQPVRPATQQQRPVSTQQKPVAVSATESVDTDEYDPFAD
jgi:hypothetical protein